VAGIAVLVIAGVMALLMVLVRTPAISAGSSTLYYQSLTGHSIYMFIFWLAFIQTGLLITAGTVLINRHLWGLKLAWAGFWFMVAGALSAGVGILMGAETSYLAPVPLSADYDGTPFIYLAFILLSIGMGLIVITFIMTMVGAVENRRSFNSWAAFLRDLPISSFAAIAGLFIAVPGLILALKLYIPALLWSLGYYAYDPLTVIYYANSYRLNWHVIFHIYHYIPALALVGVAYVLVELTADAKSVYSKHIAKALFLLYPFFVPPTFIYHLLVDPNIPEGIKSMGSILSLLVGTPTILHMFIIIGMLEARIRSAGHGIVSWLKHLPWGNPAFGSMAMGILTLGFAGVLAYLLIQEQLAPVLHNTFAVPAYIHPMAAGGANIIFMGAIYYGVTMLTGRQLWGMAIARVQPYLMAGALILMSMFGFLGGLAGVPRRTASITYAGEAPASWAALMNVSLGVGGILAVVAGALFILVIAMTLLAGKKATTVEDLFHGMIPVVVPVKVVRRTTPAALITIAAFIVVILVVTIFGFIALNLLPMR
jgi:cytochrome c oxidase subunit 1